jgi:hypothetical protein
MKKLTIYTGIIFIIGIAGCYRDVILPKGVVDPEGPPQFVSYNSELKPLFDTQCALSGCHVTGAHKPYLTEDVSYNQLVNGGFVNTSIPKESTLYIMINGDMQPYIPSAEDRQKVYDWIRNGAPNN